MQLAFNMNMLALVDGQPQTLPPEGGPAALHRLPPRGHPPPDRVRPRQGARPGPHPRGPQDRPRQPRRGDPTIRESADVETARTNLMTRFDLQRDPGPGDPRHAPRPAGGPRAQEDRGRVPRRHPAHRRAGGHPGQPGPGPGHHQGRADRAEAQVRRRAADPVVDDASPRDDRRGPDRRRGRRGHDQRPGLHQAPAGRHLPPPASRRQGDHRPRHRRGGRRRAPARGQHPRLGALLHQPRPRLQLQGPPIPDASRQAKGIPIINLPGVQVESGEGPMATITLPDFEKGHSTWSWPPGTASSRRRRSSSSRRSAHPASSRSPSTRTTSWPGSTSSGGHDDIIIATAQGKIARFHEVEVRPMGREPPASSASAWRARATTWSA